VNDFSAFVSGESPASSKQPIVHKRGIVGSPKRKSIQRSSRSIRAKCLFLLSEESLNLSGGGCLDLLSRPVELGLGHSVSKIDILSPTLLGVGSTLHVKFGVVLEDSGLLDISLVVGLLLGGFLLAKGSVVRSGKSLGNIRLGGDLTLLQL